MERSKYAPGNYGTTKSPTDIFHGFVDPVLSIGGGLLGSTVGGLMALPTLATQGVDAANNILESAQNRASYNPVNPTGISTTNEIMGALSTLAQPIEAMSQGIGDFAYDQTGSPAMGAIGQLTPDLLATAIGLPPALRAGRKLNNIGSKINPTPAPVTPFSKQQGIIAGPNAKNADMAKLADAQTMKEQGINQDLIYANTGWWLDHPDGVPRFEIDDSGAIAKNIDDWTWGAREDFKYDNSTGGPVGDFLTHDELAKSYDGVLDFGDADRRMMMSVKKNNLGGSYGDNNITVGTTGTLEGKDLGINKSVAMHELDHAVQHREGMARGGNPEMFDQAGLAEIARDAKILSNEIRARKKKYPDTDYMALENQATHDFRKLGIDILPEARDLASRPYMRFPEKHPEDYKNMMDLVEMYGLDKKTKPETPYNLYKKLAGESEARLVQDRMNMSMDERIIDPFYDNYDVPFNDMIIRRD